MRTPSLPHATGDMLEVGTHDRLAVRNCKGIRKVSRPSRTRHRMVGDCHEPDRMHDAWACETYRVRDGVLGFEMDGIQPGSVSGVEALGPAAEARDEVMTDVDVSLVAT